MRILVVEDELKMAGLLHRGLGEEGHVVDVAHNGEDAIRLAQTVPYDALVLDVMLPEIDGFEVCRRLRRADVWSPVLMLTARGSVDDRIAGLDSGADDYLVKPFSRGELLARLRALGRRGQVERPVAIEVGDLHLDPVTRQVTRAEVPISLSSKEFSLLETFMRHPGHVLSKTQLLSYGWALDYEERSNVVEVYIRYLREKVDRPFARKSIETVRGVGYRLRSDGR